ncbi:hypothetical protein ACQKN7_10765 [Bacillus cereus]|uniref:hypothetical protein n=1 Tax=Bacillus cereus TaxID=1396 RepID=UPI003D0081EC
MTTFMTTFVPVFITIISGVFVFIIGRFIEKLFIDPMKEHKTVIAEIYDGLIYHANITVNPLVYDENTSENALKIYQDASNELRRMSTKLRAATFNLQGAYWFYRLVFRAPKKKDIMLVCSSLIGLSNCLICTKDTRDVDLNITFQQTILKKLKLNKFEDKAFKKAP